MNYVSIIIPSYNRPFYLKEAIESALNQSISPKEILIIDDGSDQQNLGKILALENLHSTVRIFAQKTQQGVSHCRNIGIEKSTGEYIIFLDDDDTLHPDMIKNCLDSIGGYDVLSCRINVFCEGFERTPRFIYAYNWQLSAQFKLYEMEKHPAEHIFLFNTLVPSFFIKKTSLKDVHFPTDLVYGEDTYAWLMLAAKNFKFKKTNFIGANYRIHQKNYSLNSLIEDKLKFYFKILKELDISNQVKNMTYIKMTKVLLFNLDSRFILYLFKAFQDFDYLVIHLFHYFKVRLIALLKFTLKK